MIFNAIYISSLFANLNILGSFMTLVILGSKLVISGLFISSLVLIFILSVLLYRLKYKTGVLLEAKQEEINNQNKKLVLLAGENEWLLKEIHHRVKNNLQIVISLLNTQSAYLVNEDALEAIKSSQHRMQAMSLIHQKLYQTENLSSINMEWYIQELVNYLKDSFDIENKIKFSLDVQSVELDVAQAVPLGLILNEAISNALKYAFPDHKGQIDITLKEILALKHSLTIADNGIGLPDYDVTEKDSLGMSLMMGLTQQLDGTFRITSENGVLITINFLKK